MSEGARDEFRENGEMAREWAGVLLPPVAWSLQLQAQYPLVTYVCDHGGAAVLHLVTLAALAAALAGGFLALGVWRRAGSTWPGHEGVPVVRARFMAALGLLAAALFGLLILTQGAAAFVFHPCDR